MTDTSLESANKNILSLIPFLIFLIIFVGIGAVLSFRGEEYAFYQFPAPACALIAFACALALSPRKATSHISTFARGIGDETVILMCLIFLLAGAFSTLTNAMGAVESTVNLGLAVLPDSFILPGIFLISCFISLSMGTSMGTIATVAPIALGIANSADLSIPFTLGTVVGGSIFGDNLSVVSDTTIAACGTQEADMRSKLIVNAKIAFPAALLVCALLFFFSPEATVREPGTLSFLKPLPYVLVLALSIAGIHVVIALLLGIALAIGLGLGFGSFEFIQVGRLIYEGFSSMTDVFYSSIFVAGLAAIATKEGGLDYVLHKLNPLFRNRRLAQFGIAGLASIADLCVANNTIAILLVGKIAKKVSHRFHITPARSASLIDIFTCVWQGLIPYGAQILMAAGLAGISPLAIVPFSWYSMALGFSALVAILLAP